jgi:hypothetical protein
MAADAVVAAARDVEVCNVQLVAALLMQAPPALPTGLLKDEPWRPLLLAWEQ